MAAATSVQEQQVLVRSLTTVSVPDQVSKEIRRAILAGDLKPGETFSLRKVSAQLGVSFIPVREALRELEAQGLVIIRPGKSAMVSPLTHDDLKGIYRLRRQIEPEIAGRSSKMLTKSDVAHIEELLAVFRDENVDVDNLHDVHHQFHHQLLHPAATEWDLRVLEGLWHSAERYVRLAFADREADPAEPHRRWHAHHQLLEATLTRNARTVAAATRQHLDDNERIALGVLSAIAR